MHLRYTGTRYTNTYQLWCMICIQSVYVQQYKTKLIRTDFHIPKITHISFPPDQRNGSSPKYQPYNIRKLCKFSTFFIAWSGFIFVPLNRSSLHIQNYKTAKIGRNLGIQNKSGSCLGFYHLCLLPIRFWHCWSFYSANLLVPMGMSLL